jgi:uncharacterized cysteine cluster protein YcgN (CxxCxxCC family)
MTEQNLCLKCPTWIRGKCCHYHLTVKGLQIVSDEYCKFLTDDGYCSVYNNRFKENPNCLTLKQMIEQGTLPFECPYAKLLYKYTKKRLYQHEFFIKEI